MKKIGLISFTKHNNYGGLLQGYALFSYLSEKYPEYSFEYIEHIPDNSLRLKWRLRRCLSVFYYGSKEDRPHLIKEASDIIKGGLTQPKRTEEKDFSAFNEFYGLMNYSRKFSPKELTDCSREYEAYIVGSDQVWNPKLTFFDLFYFLDFVPNDISKFAYASSFGLSSFPKVCEKKSEKLLDRFERISCRERAGVDIVSRLCGKEAQICLDPVFLLKESEWEKMSLNSKAERSTDYVLVYAIGGSSALESEAGKYAEKNGFDIVIFDEGTVNPQIGPMEWLFYLRNARMVFTNSFHGTAFSIIFEKQFRVETGGSDYFSGLSSRIDNLLKLLCLEDRTISSPYSTETIDYCKVKSILNSERKKSEKYLEEVVLSIKGKHDFE